MIKKMNGKTTIINKTEKDSIAAYKDPISFIPKPFYKKIYFLSLINSQQALIIETLMKSRKKSFSAEYDPLFWSLLQK